MRLTGLLWFVLLPGALRAQGVERGLPAWRPVNPLVTSRSVLGHLPLRDQGTGWQLAVAMDYATLVELSDRPPASMVVDAEVMRLDLHASRDLGPRLFLQFEAGLRGAYAGFLDQAINGYHGLIGFSESRRAERPVNEFDYRIVLPGAGEVVRQTSGLALNDLTVGLGLRHGQHWQTVFRVGFPLGTGPAGYTLSRPTTALVTSARSRVIGTRLLLEASGGLGLTPSEGPLSAWQRTVFLSAAGGFRFRFWGQQSFYATAFYHSPVYHGTTMPALDREDVSLDFGFLLRPGGVRGPEIVAGLVEDLYPFGTAVDLTFRLGARW